MQKTNITCVCNYNSYGDGLSKRISSLLQVLTSCFDSNVF